ncbi:MAG: bacteriohemerythrin [Thermodesulfovibrionales bacterium]|nr:bacteriohemerythrin [Thermodesulfovibrionales bacterium]
MSFIQWNDDLSIGVQEIDDQHKGLVEMVNTLYEAMKSGENKELINNMVFKLKDYAIYHFDTEERYMQEHQYPAFADHKAKHKDFCVKVLTIDKDLQSGKGALSMEILNFLTDWLVKHINETDKKMGVFLKSAIEKNQ